jgi:putative transposase
MALFQAALLDLVEELKTTDASELMRRMLATMLQELIDAEASAVIGALAHERIGARTTRRNGPGEKTSPPGSVT